MTSSKLAAATQTRARVSPAMHPKPDALPATILPISGLGNQLRICWLAYPEYRH